jgi:hypothetical protein
LVLAVPGFDGLFFLNPSAGFIWSELRSGSSTDLIGTRLAQAFGIPVETARRDVESTLEHWERTILAPGTTYRLNNRLFRITLDSPELEAEILPRLVHLATEGEPDFNLAAAEQTVSAARAILLQEMVRLSGGYDWLALLHAGACSNGSACVVFPAPSGSGKTTLSAVLAQSGLAFHADDSVGIPKDIPKGKPRIPPMPFGLAIREGSWPILASRIPGFGALPVTTRFGQQVRFLPPAPHTGPVPAAALVFPLYDPAAATTITPLQPLDTLIHFKEAGFWVEHTPQSIQAFLDWVQSLPSYRLVYSDVDEAVAFIRTLFSDASAP